MKRAIALMTVFVAVAFLPASATIINIPDDYPTIQEGIDACGEGDTVMVADGIYYENVIINIPISLIGENRDGMVIDGSGTGDVVFVGSPNVFLNNFTVRNSGGGVEDSGIEISFADDCVVQFCRLHNCYSGLCLYGSSNNTITRSVFHSNENGIHFRESYSEPTPDNYDNIIHNNIIENNTSFGILFEHTGEAIHHSNLISGNKISGNDLGISTITSEGNVFAYNDIINNSNYGISHGMCMGGGEHNQFSHNNFILNNESSVQASDGGGGVDYWYDVLEERGNYWSDYEGPDNDGDGIGDVPYYIDGNESQDIYPLMEPLYAIIAGIVFDGLEPIEGVHVLAIGTEVDDHTGYDGMYSLEGLGAGMYDIMFTHPYYRDTIVTGVPTTPGHTTPLDVVMRIETDTDEDDKPIPGNFALFQNYPNPFNASTVIHYSLSSASEVTISIYDILGHRVETLIKGEQPAGYHQITWDAGDKSTGLYFYRIQAGEYAETRKMVLLK
ncbi:MAG: NosD domain-containing protein [candidate division Zixibacteria bacterium]